MKAIIVCFDLFDTAIISLSKLLRPLLRVDIFF